MADQMDPPVSILDAEQRTVGCLGRPITAKQQSMVWFVSQSRHMPAIFLGSLAAVAGYTCGGQWHPCGGNHERTISPTKLNS